MNPTEPPRADGLETITSEQYHAASGVSRSMLEWLSPPKTPLHFWAKYVAKLIPDEETPALRTGTLVHRCVLEPETMAGAFHTRPEGLNFSTKEGKAWKEAHADKPILTDDESKMIYGMRDSVWRHAKAAAILKTSEFERSAFAGHNGMILKARFDALPKAGNVIADLKTCDSADLESVEKSMLKYGYFRQAAFYLKVANLLGLKRDYFVFIFVEKSPPYAVACYTPSDVVLEAGTMMVNRDLQLLANCYETDRWPGYSPNIEPAALPAWAMKSLEQSV